MGRLLQPLELRTGQRTKSQAFLAQAPGVDYCLPNSLRPSLARDLARDALRASTSFFAEEVFEMAVGQRPDMTVVNINSQGEGAGFETEPRDLQAAGRRS